MTSNQLVLMIDFDGTLSEIRENPSTARIQSDAQTALSELRDKSHIDVAVISGREISDVKNRVGLGDIWYAGNHGLEIDIGERQFVHPDAVETVDILNRVCQELRDQFDSIDGCVIEEKRLTATIHYRAVEDERRIKLIQDTSQEFINENGNQLQITNGKQILEIRPAVNWNKGRAVTWILETMYSNLSQTLPVYIGDDVTDKSAFQAVVNNGIAILVGDRLQQTKADYRVENPREVGQLLTWLTRHLIRD
jgi:trehalose-phosphatase